MLTPPEQDTRTEGSVDGQPPPRADSKSASVFSRPLPTPREGFRWALVLLALAVLAHLPALRAGFIWDDDIILQNRDLQSLRGLGRIWTSLGGVSDKDPRYWPLLYTSFWIENRLWGLHASSLHLVNVLLHALNAVLLWRLLQGLRVPGAWLGAALFAVHPVTVESVAWVMERKGLLSATLALLSVLMFRPWDRHRPVSRIAFAAFLFLCALLTKPITVTLPVVLTLLVWWRNPQTEQEKDPRKAGVGNGPRMGLCGGLDRRSLVALTPFWILAVIAAGANVVLARHAEHLDFGLGWLARITLAARSLVFYAEEFILPVNLLAVYPRWDVAGSLSGAFGYPLAVGALLILLVAYSKRFGHGPFVAASAFVILHLPTLGLLDHGFMGISWVADRYQYLPAMVFAAAGAAAIDWVFVRFSTRKTTNAVVALVVVCVLGILGALTFRQAMLYRSAETLFRHTVGRNPDAWAAWNNLGSALAAQQRHDEALPMFDRVLHLHPGYARAHLNRANSLEALGRHDPAIEAYRAAILEDPNYADAYYNLGLVLARTQRSAEAIEQFREALEHQPDFPEAHYNLAVLLQERGEIATAITELRDALQLAPDYPQALNNLGYLLSTAGRDAEAVVHLHRALHLQPGWPQPALALAWIYSSSPEPSLRDAPRAIELAATVCRQAARAGVRSPDALDALAAAFAEAGRFDSAVGTAGKALEAAHALNDTALAADIQSRLDLYMAARPYRRPVSDPSGPSPRE